MLLSSISIVLLSHVIHLFGLIVGAGSGLVGNKIKYEMKNMVIMCKTGLYSALSDNVRSVKNYFNVKLIV